MWLDSRMVYSCAYFRAPDDSLDDAQAQKLDHICRKLRLAEGERLLDIGCGWGALILWAAKNYGVEAHGITLSQNQHDHVKREIEAQGLADRVRVELRDYLDLPTSRPTTRSRASACSSMSACAISDAISARSPRLLVAGRPGAEPWHHAQPGRHPQPRQRHRRLRRGVRLSRRRARARVAGDPGRRACGLEAIDAEALREHYAKTLWHWVDRLEANADAARAEVGEEKFRVWRIYMAGSAHAFDRGWLSLWQVLAGKPLARRSPAASADARLHVRAAQGRRRLTS